MTKRAKNTCPSVKVFVVDDDALAHAGEIQTVSEAVGARLGIHIRVARKRQRGPRPDGRQTATQV